MDEKPKHSQKYSIPNMTRPKIKYSCLILYYWLYTITVVTNDSMLANEDILYDITRLTKRCIHCVKKGKGFGIEEYVLCASCITYKSVFELEATQ